MTPLLVFFSNQCRQTALSPSSPGHHVSDLLNPSFAPSTLRLLERSCYEYATSLPPVTSQSPSATARPPMEKTHKSFASTQGNSGGQSGGVRRVMSEVGFVHVTADHIHIPAQSCSEKRFRSAPSDIPCEHIWRHGEVFRTAVVGCSTSIWSCHHALHGSTVHRNSN
ncbi:hypothetical protein HGRIS_013381 [Hohenbuehelia grisea]|uniref:Uncharacterized protein n=1 Tax=Hohenbuehelia grisea TaxID=104357 RepID=A0ABR3IVC7_9AGAR